MSSPASPAARPPAAPAGDTSIGAGHLVGADPDKRAGDANSVRGTVLVVGAVSLLAVAVAL